MKRRLESYDFQACQIINWNPKDFQLIHVTFLKQMAFIIMKRCTLFSCMYYLLNGNFARKTSSLVLSKVMSDDQKSNMSTDQACKNTVKSLVLEKLANIFRLMYVVNVHQSSLAVIYKSIKALLDITSKETFLVNPLKTQQFSFTPHFCNFSEILL